MFSGIVACALPLSTAQKTSSGMRLGIILPDEWAEDVKLGDSIAFNGCCLTVAEISGDQAFFDAIPETLELTNLGDLHAGSVVNLERALQAGARLDGHMVQGHVDGVGVVSAILPTGDEQRVVISCSAEFARQCVLKGSVCVDGISLTIAEITAHSLTVAIIPHTWEVTSLNKRAVGDRVNLEADMIGKYVRAHLERMLGNHANVDTALIEKLKQGGFV